MTWRASAQPCAKDQEEAAMDISLTYDRPEEGPGSGPISVGWFLTADKGAVLFDPPRTCQPAPDQPDPCQIGRALPGGHPVGKPLLHGQMPLFDLHIGFSRDDKGRPVLVNRAGAASPIRANKLGETLTLVNEAEALSRPADDPVDPALLLHRR